MDNSGKILNIEYKYPKVGLDSTSSLPTKMCSVLKLQSDREKYALIDVYKRVVLDEPAYMLEDDIVGKPSFIKAELENGSFQYEEDDFWIYTKKSSVKLITNRGTTLQTYIKNEDKLEQFEKDWNSVIYNPNLDAKMYRLAEVYLKKLYQGVSVRYIDCEDNVKVVLEVSDEIKQEEKDCIYLIHSLISELVFTRCKTYIICKDIRSMVGIDVFRKLKRIIKAQNNVVQCIFL